MGQGIIATSTRQLSGFGLIGGESGEVGVVGEVLALKRLVISEL